MHPACAHFAGHFPYIYLPPIVLRAAANAVPCAGERSSSQTVKAQLALRDLILSGELKPGDRISELSIVERLGMSRTPIRMALVRLEEEGFLEAIPSGGFAIRPAFPRPSASGWPFASANRASTRCFARLTMPSTSPSSPGGTAGPSRPPSGFRFDSRDR